MRLGLHLNEYASFGDPSQWGSGLVRAAQLAEQIGFARLSVTDHLWQISLLGEEDEPMIEAYTTLAFLASQTKTIELQTLVTAATYRSPAMLGKIMTTLDVLSGGRTWLGIGTGWNEQEATGLGLPYDGLGGRYEAMVETIQILRQMWDGSRDEFRGKRYILGSTMNVPAPLRRPKVLIGGGGERVTLKLAAAYADAFNVWGGPDAGQKITRLKEHCAAIGRDHEEIEKTALLPLDIEKAGADGLLAELERLHKLGFTTVYGNVPNVGAITPLEALGAKILPEVSSW